MRIFSLIETFKKQTKKSCLVLEHSETVMCLHLSLKCIPTFLRASSMSAIKRLRGGCSFMVIKDNGAVYGLVSALPSGQNWVKQTTSLPLPAVRHIRQRQVNDWQQLEAEVQKEPSETQGELWALNCSDFLLDKQLHSSWKVSDSTAKSRLYFLDINMVLNISLTIDHPVWLLMCVYTVCPFWFELCDNVCAFLLPYIPTWLSLFCDWIFIHY